MKDKLKPSWETYSRIIWDEQYNENNFMVGYQDRVAPSGRREKPIVEWDSSDIPWNRVQYFRCGDVLVWDRQEQIDLLGTDQLPPEAYQPIEEKKANSYSILDSPFKAKPILHYKNGTWEYYMEEHKSVTLTNLNVATYNILSDEYKQGFLPSEDRIKAVFKVLENCDADIVALQEVSLDTMRRLMEEPWMRDKYISDQPNKKHFDSHRTIIYSKFPFELYAFDYSMRKQFLVGTWMINQQTVHLAAIHLSSNRADNAPKIRTEQLKTIVAFLEHLGSDYLIAGDFNMRAEESSSFFQKQQLKDLWTRLHPNKIGATFDVTRNTLAAFFSLSKKSGRLDRMLLRSKNNNWEPKTIDLLGEEAIQKDIYPSDHFGLVTQLEFQTKETAAHPLSQIQPTYQSAIVIIPSPEKWAPIQAIRKKYDSKVARWMPHITLIYGFLPNTYFEDAALAIQAKLLGISSFSIALEDYGFFQHRKNVTAWLNPIAEELKPLHKILQEIFPQCTDEIKQANGFNPHLSVGQFESKEVAQTKLPKWKNLELEVHDIALISRTKDGPFQVDCRIALGTGAIRFTDKQRTANIERKVLLDKLLPQVDEKQQELRAFAKSILEQVCEEELGNPIELFPLGSEKLGTISQHSDMDLVALIPVQVKTADFLSGVQQRLEGISDDSRLILDARMPILRLSIEGIKLDLMCCQHPAFPATIQSIELTDWHKFDAVSWQAVSGYFEAENLAKMIEDSVIDKPLFLEFVRCIKAWAKAKGIKGNSIGYLGHYSWTVLAVWVCRQTTKKGVLLEELLLAFFTILSNHDWNTPVALTTASAGCKLNPQQDRLPIITTVKPYYNSTGNVTRSTYDTILEAVHKAKTLLEKNSFAWSKLFEEEAVLKGWKPVVFSLQTKSLEEMNTFRGIIEGNIVGLMITLEREFKATVRPNPAFVKTALGIEFQLGIKLPTPSNRNDLSDSVQIFLMKVNQMSSLLIAVDGIS